MDKYNSLSDHALNVRDSGADGSKKKKSQRRKNETSIKITKGKQIIPEFDEPTFDVSNDLNGDMLAYMYKLEFELSEAKKQMKMQRKQFRHIISSLAKYFDSKGFTYKMIDEYLESVLPQIEDFNNEVENDANNSVLSSAIHKSLQSSNATTVQPIQDQTPPTKKQASGKQGSNIIKISLGDANGTHGTNEPVPQGKKSSRRDKDDRNAEAPNPKKKLKKNEPIQPLTSGQTSLPPVNIAIPNEVVKSSRDSHMKLGSNSTIYTPEPINSSKSHDSMRQTLPNASQAFGSDRMGDMSGDLKKSGMLNDYLYAKGLMETANNLPNIDPQILNLDDQSQFFKMAQNLMQSNAGNVLSLLNQNGGDLDSSVLKFLSKS